MEWVVSADYLQVVCNHRVCRGTILLWSMAVAALFLGSSARAQEGPYFVTYSDQMEEPGNLELSYKGIYAAPSNANSFNSATVEFEYGLKAYWTTEFYLSGQTTQHDSTVFNGFRWENRVRPLLRNYWINPVIYVEYENVNKADRSFLEITGHQSISDLYLTNAQGRAETERAMELKLILSSYAHGWNFSENFIAEKNLKNRPPRLWSAAEKIATN